MIQLTDNVGHPSNILESNTLLDPLLFCVRPHDGTYQLLHQTSSHAPGASHPNLRNVSSATSDVTSLRCPDWAPAPHRRLVVPGWTNAPSPAKVFARGSQ